MNNTQYTMLVLEAYEDEVAGAAYFDGSGAGVPSAVELFSSVRGARTDNRGPAS